MKFSLKLAAAACVLMPATAFGADIIDMLMGKATELYTKKGYSPTGWSQRGSLRQGAVQPVTLTLSSGTYSVVGMCDSACSDMDIEVVDANGRQVAKDGLKDDFPIVEVPGSGTYTLKLSMVTCTNDCSYALMSFRK